MLTSNIDVSDGLTNGAVGIITYIILDEHGYCPMYVVQAFCKLHVPLSHNLCQLM